jgi:hypothetical protein
MNIKPYEVKQVNINERTFSIIAFSASDGLMIVRDIGIACSKLGKGVSSLLSEIAKNGIKELAETPLRPILEEFLNNLETFLANPSLIPLIKQIVSRCQIDGKQLKDDVFDMAFSRSYEDLFVLIKEVISFNFFSQSFTKKLTIESLKKTSENQN